ncbi:MAG: hypothetical protein M9894_24680 [Planctomycetes bacterium]|nr:hypothetical protein [Planctomycetota bacterium]
MSQHDESTRAEADARRFVLFSVAWSVYCLVHHALTYFSWLHLSGPELPMAAATLAAAVAVLLRPSSVPRLAALLGLWSSYELYMLPEVANHILLTLFIDLTVLLCLPGLPRRDEAPGGPGAALYRRFAPLVRVELLTLYLYAVLHKLNRDFFDPGASCGWELYAQMTEVLPLPRWPALAQLTILGTLACEAAIPLLLLLRRTRAPGVCFAALFHLGLALHPNLYVASFTAMLFALFTLFLPVTFTARLVELWERSPARAWWRGAGRRVAARTAGLVVGAGAVAAAPALAAMSKVQLVALVHHVGPWLGRVTFAVWMALWLTVVGRTLLARPHDQETAWATIRPRHVGVALALPLLVLLNGLSPYLGLKTQSSFAMFSNLRTEGAVNNHLFMPTVRLLDHQDDLARVLGSSDAYLAWVAAERERLPLFEVRRLATHKVRQRDFWVEVEHRGQRLRYASPGLGGDPLTPVPWLVGKLLHYRPIPDDDCPCGCRH